MSDRFSLLFETVKIGPVVAPNRFYQVPHCNGMGYRMPRALAEMRRIKAEGGWGVICTEETEIHHSSDLAPNIEGRIWSDEDIPALARMTNAVHQHGSLAGIELTHAGYHAANFYSRAVSFAPRSMGLDEYNPGQTRRADKEDLRNIRKWHREAAIRAKEAGFDIIYCYAGHDLSLAMHFMLNRYNDRTDEYGGSLENRIRFFRELIEETKDAVGDTCAVAVRMAVDELLGEDGLTHQGEAYEIVSMLAELPDLWDVNLSNWKNDSATARFKKEGFQEKYISFVKGLTTKPVVGVGRYTTPEAMVSAIERGIMDFVGAARPSIADPFLPNKIKENRIDDIRECIGCNICASADVMGVPIRCTQNPTMGEEWRRGWHPERIKQRSKNADVLIVGGGPAGLECARALGQRGYGVTVVEACREFGGRVVREATLPGLTEWRRVVDWRLSQIEKLKNVSLYPESLMEEDDILDAGFKHVLIATGCEWRKDGIGRQRWQPVPGYDLPVVFTPDDLMSRNEPKGKIVIFDDDHYYMGGVLAELLLQNGCDVSLVTPAPLVSYWSQYTLEQEQIEKRLWKAGAQVLTQYAIEKIQDGHVTFSHVSSEEIEIIDCDAVVLVTDRLSNDRLYEKLKPKLESGRLETIRVIGDAEAPGIIAQAVFSGYRMAQEFGEATFHGTPFKIERSG